MFHLVAPALYWDVYRTISKTEELSWLGLSIVLHRSMWIAIIKLIQFFITKSPYRCHSQPPVLPYWHSKTLSLGSYQMPVPLHPAKEKKQCSARQLVRDRTTLHRLLLEESRATERQQKDLCQLETYATMRYACGLQTIRHPCSYHPYLKKHLCCVFFCLFVLFQVQRTSPQKFLTMLAMFLLYRCSIWHGTR